MKLKVFTATELNKLFAGNKLYQLWVRAQRFRDHFCLHHQGKGMKVPTNQKKLGKGGVKRRGEASSLAKLDDSWIRSALLEMVNGALNYNGE
jgi:hypothetical protein